MKGAVLPISSRAVFGPFELNLRSGELHSNGTSVVLQEQPFRLLLMLTSREGDIVTRGEIKKQLWPDGTVGDFDHSINSAIKKLRRLLRDRPKQPQYIQTITRRGYKFMVPVDWAASAGVWRDKPTAEVDPSHKVTSFALATTDSRNVQGPTLSKPELCTPY